MLKIISSLFDVIFPPRETESIVRGLTKEDVIRFYSPQLFKNFLYVTSYQSPTIKALIKENKFHNSEMAAQLLAPLLERWLAQRGGLITLIPIPLSGKRYKERGYNQVTEVLKKLPPNPHWQINETVLQRKKHTTPQTSLSKAERLHNMSDVFQVAAKINEETTLVVLVDDVVTTGATLAAAHATLTQNLPATTTIVCVALAH